MDYWDKQIPEVTHKLFICKTWKGLNTSVTWIVIIGHMNVCVYQPGA